MGDDLFDAAQMYDGDYLYFFAAPAGATEFAVHGPAIPGTGVPGETAAELAWRLLDMRPGMSVLDLACGHGALAGRFEADGTVLGDGRSRRVRFVKRLFGFPELRDWLLAAGFATVAGYGEDGQPLSASHRRMVIVSDMP